MIADQEWILVRHGDTEWTEKKKLHGGRFDSPLSSRGRKQAELTGQALVDENINSIYSSPQGRALQTSEIIGEIIGINHIHPVEGFREQRYGLLEGRPILNFGDDGTAPNVLRPIANLIRNLTGETDARFFIRVLGGVTEVKSAHESGHILIVSHWGALGALMAILFGGDEKHWIENVKWSPCGITTIREIRGGWEMLEFDHTEHLAGMGR
jgi:probable phosphoglycerate mutase